MKNDTTLGGHLPVVKKRTRESVEETALVKAIRAKGGVVLKLGNLKGVPDRLTILNGRVCFIEMKRPEGGRVSAAQAHVMNELAAAGANVGCFCRAEDAIEFASR